jgi:hypothetical protein
MNPKCPTCDKEIKIGDIFCPHCGIKLPTSNVPLTLWQKIKIYSITVLLAPLGMYWFFKYIKSEDQEKRKVAIYVLCLTVAAVALTVGIGIYATKMYSDYLNSAMSGGSLYGL